MLVVLEESILHTGSYENSRLVCSNTKPAKFWLPRQLRNNLSFQSRFFSRLLFITMPAAWRHVDELQLREALDSSAYTFAACKKASQDLEQEWLSLQEAEKDDDNIVSFDCALHESYCQELEIALYPTIRMYHRDGRMDQYRGECKARELAMFRNRVIRPYFLEADAQLLEHFILLDDVVIMMRPRSQSDNWDLYDRFTALAKKYRDQFTFLMGPSINDSSPSAAVVCYNNLDDMKHVAPDTESDQALEDFVALCAKPLIPELTQNNKARYVSTGKSILYYLATTDAEKEAYRAQIRPLAKKHAESLQFTVTDINKYPEMLGTDGVEAGSTTALVLENFTTGALYHFRGSVKLTVDDIEGFLEDISSGKLQPIIRQTGQEQHQVGRDEL
ncbi:thioredoxin-like domain-containing protein [Triangularia setosa]|uniref:Thioredoxin-like domain-containing protein n=1 Tax=Triangularia setosa TaxID=2587417 RepID=A0AAN6WIF4_9PEZI|nr:thioredoxin-like domain-containing protein [Podospora setosa]